MTRQLPLLVALCLLCFITLQAHALKTTYSSSLYPTLDNVPALPGSMDFNLLVDDPCTVLHNDGFESSFGIWIDGGTNCARSNSFPNTGSWSVELKGGPTAEMYTPPTNFTGVGVTVTFSFYPQGYENGEGLLLESATNSSGSYSVFTAWIAGTNLVNNTRYNVTVPMNSINWTSNSRLRLRSLANATDDRVYIDDVVISNCCEIGAACDDRNQCTTDDVIQANCQCKGTWQDADGDGTCDAFDICPGLDDYLVISEVSCDDGDPCTVGDRLDDDCCCCQGILADWDQDGYCQNDDPNDLDACIPDPDNPACNPCTTHSNAHFESNFQIWNSGGNDCSRLYAPQYASAGNYCVRIRDDDGSRSSMFTSNMNLAGLNNVSISFSYIAVSMETSEDFLLEVSTNGGSSYTTYESWSSGTDFTNNSRKFVWIAVDGFTWTNQTRFRFRCDAGANDDAVYIDDVIIKTCVNFAAAQAPVEIAKPEILNEGPDFPVSQIIGEDVILSPNPASTELRFSGMLMNEATIDIFSISGSLMRNVHLNDNILDVSQLHPGLYFMRIENNGQVIVKRFVKE